LENDPVLVTRTVGCRDLSSRERIVERVVDILDTHSKARSGFAIYGDIGLQPALFAVGGYVSNSRHVLDAVEDTRNPFLQLIDIRAPKRELILGIALSPADPQILCSEHEGKDAGILVEF